MKLIHGGIDNAVEDRNEDDDRDGVEVLHQIVRDAMTLHLRGLGDKVV